MGCFSGVQGLAAEKRQAPAEETTLAGTSTAVLGVEGAPTPVAAHACGTR
jgi:hypothetical protein